MKNFRLPERQHQGQLLHVVAIAADVMIDGAERRVLGCQTYGVLDDKMEILFRAQRSR
jgi:hypothetical protein